MTFAQNSTFFDHISEWEIDILIEESKDTDLLDDLLQLIGKGFSVYEALDIQNIRIEKKKVKSATL